MAQEPEYEEYYDDVPEQPEQKAPAKKAKQPTTDKQKAARIANLAKGRETRMQNVAKRKEKRAKQQEYSESESDSDEDFVLKKAKHKKQKNREPQYDIRGDVQDIKTVLSSLVAMQKKQKRYVREKIEAKAEAIEKKIPAKVVPKAAYEDPTLASLRKSIFG